MKTIRRIVTALLLIIILLVLIFFVGKCAIKALYPTQHVEIITATCEEYGIDPYLVLSVIKAESNFISDAESHKNAVGLMQITEPTAQWIAEKTNFQDYSYEKLKDPIVNIHMGTWYLAYLMDLYEGNEVLALCAYNAGQGNVDKWLKNGDYSADGKNLDEIPFPETKAYTEKIASYKENYKRLYPEI